MSDDRAAPKIFAAARLIPELYFDLIARVPAGTFLFIALTILGFPKVVPEVPEWLHGAGGVLLATVVAGLMAVGYSLGILLTPWGDLFRSIYERAVWIWIYRDWENEIEALRRKHDSKSKVVSKKSAWDKIKTFPHIGELRKLYRFAHDDAKGESPQAKVILPKMSAEAKLCDHLFCAASIVLVTFYFIGSRDNVVHASVIKCTFGALCMSAVAAPFRFRALLIRQLSYGRERAASAHA